MQLHNLEQPWAPVPHTQHPVNQRPHTLFNDMLQVLQWPSCLQEKGFETHILDLFGKFFSSTPSQGKGGAGCKKKRKAG